MGSDDNSTSLTPYLKRSASGFYLAFSDAYALSEKNKQTKSIQSVIETGPYTRILSGRINTDGGSCVSNIFAVLQNDQYEIKETALTSVTNEDIDAAWQGAFSRMRNNAVFFKGQMDEKQAPKPFEPLFFCKEKNTWLPFICPVCTKKMSLCRDDELLKKNGLAAYTSSLKRYLYCPSCIEAFGKSDFYTIVKSKKDPDCVKDKKDVVNGLSQLLSGNLVVTDYPCKHCDLLSSCHQNKEIAESRIQTFSFYPFYMIICKAPQLCSVEFLKLLSGANWGEIEKELLGADHAERFGLITRLKEKSKGNTLFFTEKESPKRFFEILYLKLLFLYELYRKASSEKFVENGISIKPALEGIWIGMEDNCSRLPLLWNYNVRILDGVGEVEKKPFEQFTSAFAVNQFLATVWFYVLCVNKNNKAADIFAEIEQILKETSKEKTLKALIYASSNQRLTPENIFWTPEGKQIPEEWSGIWTDSIALGLDMAKTGLHMNPEFSSEAFEQRLLNVIQSVKAQLFIKETVQPLQKEEIRETVAATDEQISQTLQHIVDKWKDAKADMPPERASDFFDDEDTQETVIITSEPTPSSTDKGIGVQDSVQQPPAVQEPMNDEASGGWDDDIDETVVLSAGVNKAPAPPAPPAQTDDLEQTVVMPQNRKMAPAAPPIQASNGDDIDETVVISKQNAPVNPPQETSDFDEDIPETLIISPGQQNQTQPVAPVGPPHGLTPEQNRVEKAPPVQEKEEDSADDIMEETVIIRSDIRK